MKNLFYILFGIVLFSSGVYLISGGSNIKEIASWFIILSGLVFIGLAIGDYILTKL